MILSRKQIFQFTSTLSELLSSDMTLHSALEIMSGMTGLHKNCNMAACEIKSYLAEGSKFSLALKKCQILNFDEAYIAFVCSAEKSGNLERTVSFLKEREKNKVNRFTKLLTMCVYPGFVILLTFIGGLIMAFYSTKLVVDLTGNFDFDVYKKNVVTGCIEANLFLLFSAAGLIYVLKSYLDKTILLDVFTVLDFVTESGVELCSGLETAVLIAEKNMKIKNQILKTIEDIYGGKKIGEAIGNFGKNFKLYAQVAEHSGLLNKVFKQICGSLKSKFSKTEKICMELINPVIMCVVGIYIIILLKKIVMPVLFNFGI